MSATFSPTQPRGDPLKQKRGHHGRGRTPRVCNLCHINRLEGHSRRGSQGTRLLGNAASPGKRLRHPRKLRRLLAISQQDVQPRRHPLIRRQSSGPRIPPKKDSRRTPRLAPRYNGNGPQGIYIGVLARDLERHKNETRFLQHMQLHRPVSSSNTDGAIRTGQPTFPENSSRLL